MSIIKVEDIMGLFIGDESVCCACATKDEKAAIEKNEIITFDEVESGDRLYFCDRCEKPIGSAGLL